MPPLEKVGDLKAYNNTIWSSVFVVGTELTPFGGIMLWIKIVGLSRPSDSVSHTFHDGYNIHRLNVEVVL